MHTFGLKILLALALQCLVGCAAMLTGPGIDQSELLHTGTTEADLIQRLGPPIRTEAISPYRKAVDLWESDRKVSLLAPQAIAVTESAFKFKGRLGSRKDRASQAGFDSFVTLGLAEVFLIPKALWERATDEELQLTVWFDSGGRALAFKWATPAK